MDIKNLQQQIIDLKDRIDMLEGSSTIPRDVETAFKERLNFNKIPTIITGTDTPTNTSNIPAKYGDIYIDLTNLKVYCATGISAVTDYKILN